MQLGAVRGMFDEAAQNEIWLPFLDDYRTFVSLEPRLVVELVELLAAWAVVTSGALLTRNSLQIREEVGAALDCHDPPACAGCSFGVLRTQEYTGSAKTRGL